MKKIILIFIMILPLTAFSQIGTKNYIDQNFIEVTGKAEMEIIPNEIYLKIIIDEKDFNGKKQLEEIEKLMIGKLTEIGIDISEKLAIKDMVSNFKNYWLKASKIHSIREYQLEVNDAKTAGLVFQGLESLGISNISIDRIEHSEIQKFKKEVKIQAIKAARDKASSLANAINQNIGKAIYIQEIENPFYKALEGRVAGLSNIVVHGYSDKMELGKNPEIEFEKIKLEYSILCKFELK